MHQAQRELGEVVGRRVQDTQVEEIGIRPLDGRLQLGARQVVVRDVQACYWRVLWKLTWKKNENNAALGGYNIFSVTYTDYKAGPNGILIDYVIIWHPLLFLPRRYAGTYVLSHNLHSRILVPLCPPHHLDSLLLTIKVRSYGTFQDAFE